LEISTFWAVAGREPSFYRLLPLRFEDRADYDSVNQGDVLTFDGLRAQLSIGTPVTASLGQREVRLAHDLSALRRRWSACR
jgi:hypothetical protein